MPIRQLSEHVVNQIAAGEVVDRPASVAKELIENAIDAGASRIEVDLIEGGLDLLQVRDNGDGIPPNELPLAVSAHATSKVVDVDDLEGIATMGFRGEALASIASVSRLQITSRVPGTPAGGRLVVDHGNTRQVEPCGAPEGTCVEVGGLFARVPARRKFMKTPRGETTRVRRVVRDLAAAHPSVGFTLRSNDRVVLELPGEQTLRDRCVALLGRELGDVLIDVESHRDGVTLSGLIGPPDTARPGATHQIVCLNGRPIVDRSIRHAMREAYRGLIEPSRSPVAALFLGVDPARVDVNVHPAKTEVRLRDERLIFVVVRDAIKAALEGRDLIPTLPTPRPNVPQEPRALFGSGLAASSSQSVSMPRLEQRRSQPIALDGRDVAGDDSDAIEGVSATLRFMQVHDAWLLVEDESGILIVDQHALHERVMFERLLERLQSGDLPSQRLMVPIVVDLDSTAIEGLEKLRDLIQRLGVDLTPMGPGQLALHAAPVLLIERGVDLARFIEDLSQSAAALHEADTETALRDVIDMMACKAAIKAGDRLTQRELQDLLEARDAIERASNCPHGRPTTMRLTLDELERRFGRS
ncbi:MAG: DNA mismatch repair endonuclease MutL [Phycisphaerales bacterium]|nr:DNA mismatch repair endonuclease MutL [Phycisphaerales bacterium]